MAETCSDLFSFWFLIIRECQPISRHASWNVDYLSSVEVQHKKIPVFCSSFQLVVFKTYRCLVSWKHRSRLHEEAAGVQGFRRSLWFPECHGVPCEGRGVETNEFPWPRQDLQWQVPTWQWNHASSSLHRNLCFHWGLVVGRCRFLLGSCTAFLFRLEHEALSTLQHFTFHPWFWCNFFLSWSTLQICSGWARDSFLMARHHLLSSLPKCGFLCEPCAGASLNASSAMLHRLRLLPPSRAALTWTLGSDSCDAHGNMHHLWLQHLQCQQGRTLWLLPSLHAVSRLATWLAMCATGLVELGRCWKDWALVPARDTLHHEGFSLHLAFAQTVDVQVVGEGLPKWFESKQAIHSVGL